MKRLASKYPEDAYEMVLNSELDLGEFLALVLCKLPLKLGHDQLEFSNILSTKRLPSILEGFPFAVCG
jgi:hypothetical protein